MKYRLGLDVGTNSLGWSVLRLDAEDNPCAVEMVGSRIFSDGRDSKSKATLAADRREARSARRRRDRYKQRRAYLLAELTRAGLFPEDKTAQAALQKLNPLELRARLLNETAADILADLNCDSTIKPEYLVGRALFHLNQRRGFQSNRKDRSEETTSGKVSSSVRKLLQEMNLIGEALSSEDYKALDKHGKKQARQDEAQARKDALAKLAEKKAFSFGTFLYQRQQNDEQTRARPNDDGKLYDVYPTRDIYKDEFNKIWDAQIAAIPKDIDKAHFHDIIFFQRPLKPQERGNCTYLNKEKRTFRAMPSFQHYRIYQEINNLEWRTAEGNNYLTHHPEARNAIIEKMQAPSLKEKPTDKNASVGFAQMKTILKNMDLAEGNFEFNFETPKRKGLDGNLTSNVMQHEDYVGTQWHKWDLEKQDHFIDLILDDELQDEEVKDHLINKYGLSDHAAENCMRAPLVEGTASLSQKAALLMLAKMRDGMKDENGEWFLPIQTEAAAAVAREVEDFNDPMRRKKTDEADYEPLPHLPYYGKAFAEGSHIIPGSNDEKDAQDDKKFYGGVTNPTVHIALNQIRQVVNELIDRNGHPHSIAIELGRELPEGADKRNEIEREQKANQDKNAAYDKILHEQNQQINRDNRLRLELWEELDKNDPAGRRCPFSGEVIGIANLFSGETEIEHLIPFSFSLDDSRANKVISYRKCNRDKGNRTPFEAFGDSPDTYDWGGIAERVLNLPKSKQWRFQEDAREIWQRDHADFTDRHLNDTRYIGRLTREYLENICHIDKIDVLTGRLTALLRGHWGLNSVLQGDNLPDDEKKKKNRDDHRHHAVDAIVIGMTNKSILQKVATQANKAEELKLDRLFYKDENGHSAIDPWDGFRDDVKNAVRDIIVSHKVRRKKLIPGQSTDGQLHNDTALGLIKPINEAKNEWKTVVRRPIEYLIVRKRVEAIRDDKLREEFLQAFDEAEAVGKKGHEGVVDLAREKNIRRLRCEYRNKIIPISDKNGNIYKGYQGDSNWGIEIYAFPAGHKKADKWEGVVISRFEANKSGFQPGTTFRPEPTARLVMRLQINECIEIEQDGEKKQMRLQLVSQKGDMSFVPLNEANVDKRNRDKDDDFKYLYKTANPLRALKAHKIHISPTGQINRENRNRKKHGKKS